MRTTFRVGGVPEHFNLPWLDAIAADDFAATGRSVEWVEFPSGTGAIIDALEAGEIDLATPLTEGTITAIAHGATCRILRPWVSSPLLWGVHVAGWSSVASLEEALDGRFAISRFGSGSELMAHVLAGEHGRSLTDEHFVEVGGLAGAVVALPAGDAEVFLWNRSMTQPHVDDGTFRRIAVQPTPWPSFVLAVAGPVVETELPAVRQIADIATARAHRVAADPATPRRVAERYGLDLASATAWFAQIEWAPAAPTPPGLLDAVTAVMLRLGRIDAFVPAVGLLAPEPDALHPA